MAQYGLCSPTGRMCPLSHFTTLKGNPHVAQNFASPPGCGWPSGHGGNPDLGATRTNSFPSSGQNLASLPVARTCPLPHFHSPVGFSTFVYGVPSSGQNLASLPGVRVCPLLHFHSPVGGVTVGAVGAELPVPEGSGLGGGFLSVRIVSHFQGISLMLSPMFNLIQDSARS